MSRSNYFIGSINQLLGVNYIVNNAILYLKHNVFEHFLKYGIILLTNLAVAMRRKSN